MNADESALRARLGIPTDAESVLIFGESSHWDPNWLFTSEEYYGRRIERILDEVIAALVAEPRRIFSVEALFFLRRYWERRPDQREILRQLVNDGRLRLTGTGITTPDTVLPDTELILRDYLDGQEWLRTRRMTPEPRLAYLPDDFGHSPALPSMLRALGFDHAAITRIDGMYFVATDYRRRKAFPLPGSSAELLERDLRTVDFVWRAPDGAEVLCHWNAFTYFQGDMLAHVGVIRWMGVVFGMSWRTRRHIARRVRAFVRQLRPLARTPYLFCPMGCDFNGPIHGLVGLLDRYNRTHYQETGVWAVNAGMDDYMTLVDHYRPRLPTLTFDPNPYWMGFYASRPDIKVRCNRIGRKLVLLEKLTAVPAPGSTDSPDPELRREIGAAWDLLIVSNHHDFVTGTAPDRVWHAEQGPWLTEAEGLADSALARVRATRQAPPAPSHGEPPQWTLADGRVEVTTRYYKVVLSAAAGGCITVLDRAEDGRSLISGPANDLVAYRDSGGLWRMGHEYRGGVLREVACASRQPATVRAIEEDGVLQVRVDSRLEGRPFVRFLWFRDDSPIIRLRIVGAAARRRTITCRFPTTLVADRLTMDVPGGVVERPAHKLYSPTFWPARNFVFAHDHGRGGRGMAAFLGGPACATLRENGALEWVALRNVPRERAFLVLPLLAHPASGTDPDEHTFDYAVWFTRAGDVLDNKLPIQPRQALGTAWFAPATPDLDAAADAVVTCDRDDVRVAAVKPADRGAGVIVRLGGFGRGSVVVRVRCAARPVRAARLCDARERDLSELRVEDGAAVVPVDGAIVSVRLLF
ncbi:MAG: hypothetical protein PHU25_05680 [Deltaproteobacteria bacterium]|nr:hypothetical protein [Deltaproteobacteria bacterium]